MRLSYYHLLYGTALGLLVLNSSGCSDEMHQFGPQGGDDGLRLELKASIDQQSDTRADESGFADGDRFGLFVVNYSGNEPGKLTLSDNQVNNVAITYNADANTWQSATDIYWHDPITPADVYGYYPFFNGMSDIDAYNFEIRADQSVNPEGEMCAYEASDLLWAKAAKAQPGKKVELTFSHIMAGVKVVLEQGSGFDGDAWSRLEKTVTVDNTVRTSEVNLSTGTVAPTGSYDRNVVMNPEGEAWRAVVVPQTVAAGKSTIGITIDGKSYSYTRSDGMKYAPGKLHTFTIKIDRKADSGDYALTLVNEDIIPWEADQTSHDFESNSYLVVHVAEEGTLKDCLKDMHVDAGSIRNLKVTGKLSKDDFKFIREQMISLTAINLKDVKLIKGEVWHLDGYYVEIEELDDALTAYAFDGMLSLRRVILPQNLKIIGLGALQGLTLSSTIEIPESVTVIGNSAFWGTHGVFTIVLPSKLEYIEDAAFYATQAYMDLKLPKTLKYIGAHAFMDAHGVSGTFALPNNLEYIGWEAFWGCGNNLDGEIVIPDKLTKISEGAFAGINFSKPVRIVLHDGVTQIGNSAFADLRFSTPVSFPKNLTYIGERAFYNCRFSGDVVLPEKISYIGEGAFDDTNIKGTFEIPGSLEIVNHFLHQTLVERLMIADGVEVINDYVCSACWNMNYLKIGKDVTEIGDYAFEGCWGLQTIVCLAKEPPVMSNSAFSNIDYEHCVVEVPEASVEAYRKADGWSKFKSITPHHELSLSLSQIDCLNKEFSRDMIIRAEGPWEIEECPDWIHVSPDHAEYKEEISVSIDALSMGAGNREGQVVFRLKDSGYTNYFTVHQYDYEEPEDNEIVIQKATGKGTAIPVFIVGEGYGAESIVSGEYLDRAKETVDHLFAIEPYKSYRDLFSVSTAISLSADNGASDILTRKDTKFNLTFPGIDGWSIDNLKTYVKEVSDQIDDDNISNAMIIVLSNYEAFLGDSYHDRNTDLVAACVGVSHEEYPYDNRGLILNIVGGAAFGGLANEQVNHFEFIKGCTCPGCNALEAYQSMKSRGLFENVSMSGKSEDAPWKDFIYHPKYSYLVDMYEGGYNHLRGVWRSEPESVMSNFIPYYNTISRYAIYKQIMKRAGLTPTLEEFINNDKIEIPN